MIYHGIDTIFHQEHSGDTKATELKITHHSTSYVIPYNLSFNELFLMLYHFSSLFKIKPFYYIRSWLLYSFVEINRCQMLCRYSMSHASLLLCHYTSDTCCYAVSFVMPFHAIL